MKVNSIFPKKKRYKTRAIKKKEKSKKECTKCFVRTKKKKQIHRLPLYVFKQKSLSINCKILNWCSQLDKQQPPVFPSFRFHQFLQQPSSSNFSNWKSTTASTPSKGNVNTLKSYSNDLVSSLQSGLIACPKAEQPDFYPCIFTCIRFSPADFFLSIIDHE